mmetsp:Transcript_9045/g.15905  ORF Transcript_9045/g.15905 Transcript_9045/m.15905 type:complete len:453 (+) Transcript_9045:140-1498(+)
MAAHDPVPKVLGNRWPDGPKGKELIRLRQEQQDNIREAIKIGREKTDIGPLERNAKKLELQAFLAADNYAAYVEDCGLIVKWLPTFKSGIPPYDAFPNAHFRETTVSDKKAVGKSSAMDESEEQPQEESPRNNLFEGSKTLSQLSTKIERVEVDVETNHKTPRSKGSLSMPRRSFSSTPLKFNSTGHSLQNQFPATPLITKKVNNPVMASAPNSRTRTPNTTTHDVRAFTPSTSPSTDPAVKAALNPSGRISKSCTCTKSGCLKLYCGCFASSSYCDFSCKCQGCKNNAEHVELREAAVYRILTRYPEGFTPKESRSITCTCKKSRCLKMYCDCFAANATCSTRCRCTNCQNFDGSAQLLACRSNQSLLGKSPGPPKSPASQPRRTPLSKQKLSHHSGTIQVGSALSDPTHMRLQEGGHRKKRKSLAFGTPLLKFPVKRTLTPKTSESSGGT